MHKRVTLNRFLTVFNLTWNNMRNNYKIGELRKHRHSQRSQLQRNSLIIKKNHYIAHIGTLLKHVTLTINNFWSRP